MWGFSSLTRDWTCVPYIARWILSHWTTREVPGFFCHVFKFCLFIGCAGSCYSAGFSLVAASGGYSLGGGASHCWGFLLRSVASRAQAQWLWPMGLVVPWHVGSSHSRDGTHVACIGRILWHWATRKAPDYQLFKNYHYYYFLAAQHILWDIRFLDRD